jgi:small subunit ribosomal protein S3Ae
MAIQKKGSENWKMKKWFSVYAPKVFNDALVGEMPGNDEKSVIGRNIVVGLDSLTKNPSNAYAAVTLKVIDVNGSAAHTKLVSISQLYSYIRSLVRRYRSVASSVLPVVTKDGTNMVVKMLVITKARTTHSRITGIREEMNAHTAKFFSENDANAAITAVVDGKFQAELGAKLRHITPLNKVEVKTLEVK